MRARADRRRILRQPRPGPSPREGCSRATRATIPVPTTIQGSRLDRSPNYLLTAKARRSAGPSKATSPNAMIAGDAASEPRTALRKMGRPQKDRRPSTHARIIPRPSEPKESKTAKRTLLRAHVWTSGSTARSAKGKRDSRTSPFAPRSTRTERKSATTGARGATSERVATVHESHAVRPFARQGSTNARHGFRIDGKGPRHRIRNRAGSGSRR